MSSFNIPKEIITILEKLQDSGFEVYLVGGCVRDLLMDKTPKDWDITTNAKPEEIQKVFEKSVYENNFGTVGVFTGSENPSIRTVEITPFRMEAKYSDKRHPDKIKFAEKLTDDLKRRDFTINAIALSIKNYEIIDLFNGQEDIKNKIIKTVGGPKERFSEDALRIMRAVRFASELKFEIEKETEKAMEELSGLISVISKERIRDELIKIIMSEIPDKAFYKMRELGILKIILPEFDEGWGVTQNKHHIYTVFDHNINALMHAVSKNWPFDIRIASLFHDIGKPRVKRGEGPDATFYNHETVGAKIAGSVLRRFKFPVKLSHKIIKLIRWHLFFSDTEKITLSAVRRVIRNVGEENIWDLMKVRFSDRVGMGRPKAEPYRLRKYESMIEEALRNPISAKMLKIKGDDIMKIAHIPQGPMVGKILNVLLEEVLDNPKFNNKEYLERRTEKLSKLTENEITEAAKKAKQKSADLEELKIREIRKKYFVE